MNCQFCNAENADDAVFCKECGKRIDGKTICPACGQTTEIGTYCNRCGASLEGKTRCSCGTVFKGDFCPSCEKPAVTPVARVEFARPAARSASGLDWRKIVMLVASAVAVLGVLAVFVLCFFNGYKLNVNGSATTSILPSGIALSTQENIWHYFGGVYTAIKEALDGMESYTETYFASTYALAIFGTVMAAATVIAVPVLAILTIVRFVLSVLGKTKKSVAPLAFATYFVYLFCAFAFKNLSACTISMIITVHNSNYGVTRSIFASVGFNGATIAGIIVGGICLGIFAVAHIVVNAKDIFRMKNILPFVCSVAAAAFLLVSTILVSGTVIGVEGTHDGGPMFISISYLALSSGYSLSSKQPEFLLFAYCLVAQILATATLALFFLTLRTLCMNVIGRKSKGGFPLLIVVFCTALAWMIFSILAIMNSLGNMGEEDVTAVFGKAVVAVVFALLALVAMIVKIVFEKIPASQLFGAEKAQTNFSAPASEVAASTAETAETIDAPAQE